MASQASEQGLWLYFCRISEIEEDGTYALGREGQVNGDKGERNNCQKDSPSNMKHKDGESRMKEEGGGGGDVQQGKS